MPLGLGHVWLVMWLYLHLFFLSLCTSVHTFLREKTDDLFIWNNLSNGWASHLERWCQLRARVVAGAGCRSPGPPARRPQHTRQPPQIQFHGAWVTVWLGELILLSWYLTSSLFWKRICTAFPVLDKHAGQRRQPWSAVRDRIPWHHSLAGEKAPV